METKIGMEQHHNRFFSMTGLMFVHRVKAEEKENILVRLLEGLIVVKELDWAHETAAAFATTAFLLHSYLLTIKPPYTPVCIRTLIITCRHTILLGQCIIYIERDWNDDSPKVETGF
jgi:hypothetical protein